MAIGSVSGYWMGGRPSGLPENLEDQLAEARREKTVTPIKEDISEAESLKETLTNFSSNISQLVQYVDPLADKDTFDASSAESSNPEAISVEAGADASNGTYDLQVNQLAKAHTHQLTLSDTDSGDPVNDAAVIADGVDVSFSHGGESYSYTTDGETTLNSLAEQINGDANGVRASVNNVGSSDNPEYAMILKSETTGAGSNQITKENGDLGIDVTDPDTGDPADLVTTGNTVDSSIPQAGQNAEFTVDGVQYSRASNEFDDVVKGVNMELHEASSAQISVQRDMEAVTGSVSKFVEAFNASRGYIDQQTNYDPETEESGPLQGSSIANSIERKMVNAIHTPVGDSDAKFQYLSEIGMSIQRDGSLALDEQKFTEAFSENPEAVQDMFAGENGVAETLKEQMTSYTDKYGGMLTSKINSVSNKINDLNDDLDDAEAGVEDYLERMVEKFSAMESAISEYKSMEGPIESMNDSLNASNKG